MFNKGDKVKFGQRGTVTYTVEAGGITEAELVSDKTGTRKYAVPTEKLILVKAAEPVRDPIMPVRESMFSDEEKAKIMRDVDGAEDTPVEEQTSYQKTILRALNVLGKHVYQGTAKNRTKRARAKLAKKARRNARRANTARFLEMSNAEETR